MLLVHFFQCTLMAQKNPKTVEQEKPSTYQNLRKEIIEDLLMGHYRTLYNAELYRNLNGT